MQLALWLVGWAIAATLIFGYLPTRFPTLMNKILSIGGSLLVMGIVLYLLGGLRWVGY